MPETYRPGEMVRFFPGPRSMHTVDARVVGSESSSLAGAFLVTEDSSGKRRKVRPGNIIARVNT